MKKGFIIYLFILVCVLFMQCTRDHSVAPSMNNSRELTSLEKALVEADVAFGLNLFREIVQSDPDKNIFISPLSVAMALGMTLNGAAGSTEEAMRRTLEFGDMTQDDINASFQSLMELLMSLDPDVRFDIANSIWYRLGFHVEQDFIDVNRTYFDAEVRELDFSLPEAPGIINAWVDDKTQGKIEEVIDQIDPLVVMFLINAIYFKGTWTYEFDEELTQDDMFTTAEGTQVSCRMMNQESEFSYFETEDFQAVDLPYGDGKFSMTILLPKPGVHLDSLIDEFTPQKWTSWTGNFTKTEGIVQLPKFRIEYERSLVDVLTAMGMGVAFNAGQADFSRINDTEQLFISEVLHKTYVDVDEKGTEAAAVTVVVVELTGVGGSGFVMRVDRPFVFVIRERQSNALCFMGKIVEPTINQ